MTTNSLPHDISPDQPSATAPQTPQKPSDEVVEIYLDDCLQEHSATEGTSFAESDMLPTHKVYTLAFLSGALACLVVSGINAALLHWSSRPLSSTAMLLLSLLPIHGAAVVAILLFLKQSMPVATWKQRLQWRRETSLPANHAVRSFLFRCFTMIVVSLLVNTLSTLVFQLLEFSPQPQQIIQMIHTNSEPLFLLTVLSAVAVLAPFSEEIIFRLVTFNTLRVLGNLPAMIITSLVFALAHGQLHTIPGLFVIGVFLQKEKETGGLRRSMLMHSLYNLFQIALAMLFLSIA